MNVSTNVYLSDNELIDSYRNGNYASFDILLARHQAKAMVI